MHFNVHAPNLTNKKSSILNMKLILSKIRTVLWYLARPKYYSELFALIKGRLFKSKSENSAVDSVKWCSERAITTEGALAKFTGASQLNDFSFIHSKELEEAADRASKSAVKMGGAGNLSLIYGLAEQLQATRVIETGVAYGWSSLAILLSITKRGGSLISVDMPYAKMGNEDFVGIAVPAQFRKSWELIRLPDSKGLPLALEKFEQIDFCHYDSDKSYAGRMFAYPKLWNAIREGGMLISDDIQDNTAFRDYCLQIGREPVIVSFENKFIGVLLK